ncbi:MAG: phage tail tape measure protein, partial [Oscillospiraceae bacterium]|nr:phage tail tape measure protein [Oscillospiraceae bacterium]
MADGYLNFDTKINTQGYDKGIQSLGKSLGGLKKGLLGIAAAAGAAFSVKVLVDFGKQAVSLASDLQEVQNVVDTAFGDMSHKMEQFADTAIEMYGLSKLTAKQTGSTFMAMASSMGIAAASASDMAVSLTGLSADMASFYNVAQDVSSTALKSIFTGETE